MNGGRIVKKALTRTTRQLAEEIIKQTAHDLMGGDERQDEPARPPHRHDHQDVKPRRGRK